MKDDKRKDTRFAPPWPSSLHSPSAFSVPLVVDVGTARQNGGRGGRERERKDAKGTEGQFLFYFVSISHFLVPVVYACHSSFLNRRQ